MKIDVLDIKGKAVDKIDLDKSIFGVEPRESLISQYVRVYLQNKRQGTSSTKTRGEVSGGGKKPWRQKGTGRARVGSNRSPLWRHGGIIHGPKPKSWTKGLTKKMRKLALASALSLKIKNKHLFVLENLKIKQPNTKELQKILTDTKSLGRHTLIILSDNDMVIRKSASNISAVSTSLVSNVNAYEVLRATDVVFVKESVIKLHGRYGVDFKSSETTKSDTSKVDKDN